MKEEKEEEMKCINCNAPMEDASHAIIPEAKSTTILFSCPRCELLLGRYS